MLETAAFAGQARKRQEVLDIDWGCLALLMGTVLLVALYGLCVSGYFPAEYRPAKLQRGWGLVVLWSTLIAAGLAGVTALILGWRTLPWYAIVIGAGAVLLFAPLLLQPLPDSIVNGRRGLLAFAAGAVLLAALMWRAA
jgi:hypothetical protein